MSIPAWHEKPISKKHDRKLFDCGDSAINEFLRKYARQSHEAGGAKTFVAVDDADGKTVLGFYSLAPGALAYADTPEQVRKGSAHHDVPGFRLARIATGKRLQGGGLGGQHPCDGCTALLARRRRCGGGLLMIDAKNGRAAGWYASYGAVALADKPLTLVMALATFEAELKTKGLL
jgi:hypothetical protein